MSFRGRRDSPVLCPLKGLSGQGARQEWVGSERWRAESQQDLWGPGGQGEAQECHMEETCLARWLRSSA